MKLDFIKIASIIKTHGYRGDIILKKDQNISDGLFDKYLEEGNAVFISKDGIPVPFFIAPDSLYFIDEQTAQLALDDTKSLEKAKLFIGNHVFVASENIDSIDLNGNKASSWINFVVEDKQKGFIGVVTGYNDSIPKNPLVVVANKEKEILIPLNSDLIQNVDVNKKKLFTNLPYGFLDIF